MIGATGTKRTPGTGGYPYGTRVGHVGHVGHVWMVAHVGHVCHMAIRNSRMEGKIYSSMSIIIAGQN